MEIFLGEKVFDWRSLKWERSFSEKKLILNVCRVLESTCWRKFLMLMQAVLVTLFTQIYTLCFYHLVTFKCFWFIFFYTHLCCYHLVTYKFLSQMLQMSIMDSSSVTLMMGREGGCGLISLIDFISLPAPQVILQKLSFCMLIVAPFWSMMRPSVPSAWAGIVYTGKETKWLGHKTRKLCFLSLYPMRIDCNVSLFPYTLAPESHREIIWGPCATVHNIPVNCVRCSWSIEAISLDCLLWKLMIVWQHLLNVCLCDTAGLIGRKMRRAAWQSSPCPPLAMSWGRASWTRGVNVGSILGARRVWTDVDVPLR